MDFIITIHTYKAVITNYYDSSHSKSHRVIFTAEFVKKINTMEKYSNDIKLLLAIYHCLLLWPIASLMVKNWTTVDLLDPHEQNLMKFEQQNTSLL